MISDQYDDIIMQAASDWAVPFEWIKAVIGAESDFSPSAYRAEPQINDASYGLMQILGRTASGLGYSGAVEGLYDPTTNINLGAKLLGQLIDSWGMDFSAVYSAYNSGSGTAYKTNTDVAAHVNRALNYLDQVTSAIGQTVSDYPVASGSAGALILGLAALYLVLRRRRKGKK